MFTAARSLEWPHGGTLIPSLLMHAGRRGDFLGQASLGWEQLHLLPGEASREMSLSLGFRDDAPKRDQELVQGTVQILVEAPVIEVRNERGRVPSPKYFPAPCNADLAAKGKNLVSGKKHLCHSCLTVVRGWRTSCPTSGFDVSPPCTANVPGQA